jgi:hypothetical protein
MLSPTSYRASAGSVGLAAVNFGGGGNGGGQANPTPASRAGGAGSVGIVFFEY